MSQTGPAQPARRADPPATAMSPPQKGQQGSLAANRKVMPPDTEPAHQHDSLRSNPYAAPVRGGGGPDILCPEMRAGYARAATGPVAV